METITTSIKEIMEAWSKVVEAEKMDRLLTYANKPTGLDLGSERKENTQFF